MDREEYRKLFDLEEYYWWYVDLRRCVFDTLKKYIGKNKRNIILDAGCGTGFLLSKLKRFGTTFGIDISRDAINLCKKRELQRLTQGTVSQLPYRRDTFDIIISLDVLYHKAAGNDKDVLKEFYQVLRPNGLLIINVPAFEFMYSQHDLAVHTKKRYTREGLKKIVEDAKFNVEKIVYRNIFLFPLIMIFRMYKKIKRNPNQIESDLKRLPFWLNKVLEGILQMEDFFTSKFVAPFGLSVYCVARKD